MFFKEYQTALFRTVATTFLSVGLASTSIASDNLDQKLKDAIESNTSGKVSVSGVAKTPIPGIYEITSGPDIFYADSTGRYGFVDGRLVDMKEGKDLTAMRLEKLSMIDFKELPLDLAIKTVHGNGKRVLAVFEDPACQSCVALHKFLEQIPDATVYTFMYPIVSPDSIPKAQAAWCSTDRAKAWSTLMHGGQITTSPKCDTSGLARIAAVGDKLNIAGTPTVFLPDGRRLVGATPPDQLMAAIDEAAKKK